VSLDKNFAELLVIELESAAIEHDTASLLQDRERAMDRLKKIRADLIQALTVPHADVAEDEFLRDQFAMAALQALIPISITSTIIQECKDAYAYADQMMIARKGKA
jgi:hypothetical protein